MDYSYTEETSMEYPGQYDSYQQVDPATAMAAGMFGLTTMVVGMVFLVLILISYWKIFTKAGKPGWAAIIPFYNLYTLIKVVQRPGWWLILFFIPLVNFVISIIIALDLAKVFGKSAVFGIFLNWLLQPVGPIILAFGSAKYKK